MRGIRFINKLSKEFHLNIIKQSWVNKYQFYHLKGKRDFLLYVYRTYIIITMIPHYEIPFIRIKNSEKYKIKQLIHEALSE